MRSSLQDTESDFLDGLGRIVDDLTFALRHICELCICGHIAVTAGRVSSAQLS